jgi:cell division protein ZipA
VSELRWLLLLTGLVVLAVVFFFSRGDADSLSRKWSSRRRDASAGRGPADVPIPPEPVPLPAEPGLEPVNAERIVAVRLMSREREGFAGEGLVLALRDAGLRHGQFGIFHRHDSDHHILFSVASLVEPGAFDLSQLKNRHYPGVSLFLLLPGAGDRIAAFDEMLATGRALAAALDGELLDEQGSRLSVQRERYLREEVIQFRAAHPAS